MMFELDVNGRVRAVSIEADGADGRRFRVTLDGRTYEVDAVGVDGSLLSLIIEGADRTSLAVGIVPGGASGALEVCLPDANVRVLTNGRRRRVSGETAAGPAGEQEILAPMPGKVLRVLVQPGDEVKARQPLVVVEAMKMENELSAPRPGRVKDILVTEGTSVEAGRLLAVVE